MLDIANRKPKIIHFQRYLMLLLLLSIAFLILYQCVKLGSVEQTDPDSNTSSNIEGCSTKMYCDQNDRTQRLQIQLIKDCYPTIMQGWLKWLCILNVCVLILVGGVGNLLTLISVNYAMARYKSELRTEWTVTTFLVLHLSFCDLAYISIGLTGFLDIYINDGFIRSPTVCWITAMCRHIICYADFMTLALIAILRLIAFCKLAKQELKLAPETQAKPNESQSAAAYCTIIWILAFTFISPMLFEIKTGHLDWGRFGWHPMMAACNTVTCTESYFNGSAVIYTFAFFIPFFILMVSYIAVIPSMLRSFTANDREFMKVEENKINRALALLALSYTVFTAPLVFIEWIDTIEMAEKTRSYLLILGYNWYFWIYGINFIVYIVSLEDFRKMYKLFVYDMLDYIKCCTWRQTLEIKTDGQPIAKTSVQEENSGETVRMESTTGRDNPAFQLEPAHEESSHSI